MKDYDEAIDYFTSKIGLTLMEDTKQSETRRWVVISGRNDNQALDIGCNLILGKASTDSQCETVGKQCGDEVFLFLNVKDFYKQYNLMTKNNVVFLEKPRHEPYGIVVQWKDLYGNKWDLIQNA